MAVLQPQKVIHDSSHLWPKRSENKFLRILSLGPPTRSQPFAEAIRRYYPGYSPFGSWRARSRLLGSFTASSRLSATRPKVIVAGSSVRIARDPGAILADLNVPLMSQVSMCHTNAVIRIKRGDSRVEIGEPRGEIAAAPSYLCA